MDEVTKVKFEAVEAAQNRHNYRITKLEDTVKEIQELVLSVQKLADSMEQMLKEQARQGARLEKLEQKPAEAWSTMQRTVFNTIVGACAGALAIGLIQLIASNM